MPKRTHIDHDKDQEIDSAGERGGDTGPYMDCRRQRFTRVRFEPEHARQTKVGRYLVDP